MPNHFHFLVRIKSRCTCTPGLIKGEGKHDSVSHQTGFEQSSNHSATLQNLSGVKPPHQHFSNLFNSYSKSFNKLYNRYGSLFLRPFRRKLIEREHYLKTLIPYIHNNPVHHGFTSHPAHWSWSSYTSMVQDVPTRVKRSEVLELFDGLQNFKAVHQQKASATKIEKWLEFEDE